MFRRLAEAFQDSDGSHSQYINSQNNYFNTLPNIVLSGTSGLKGFDTAIQSVDTLGKGYQQPAVKNPNDIFMQDSSPNLSNLAQQCSASSVDELLAIKNPNAAPTKKKKETKKIMNLVFFNSFSFNAGFTNDQNCQKINGNAMIIPPINAILIALKNCPPNVVLCNVTFTGGIQNESPKCK